MLQCCVVHCCSALPHHEQPASQEAMLLNVAVVDLSIGEPAVCMEAARVGACQAVLCISSMCCRCCHLQHTSCQSCA
jgi:hypothetical protein